MADCDQQYRGVDVGNGYYAIYDIENGDAWIEATAYIHPHELC